MQESQIICGKFKMKQNAPPQRKIAVSSSSPSRSSTLPDKTFSFIVHHMFLYLYLYLHLYFHQYLYLYLRPPEMRGAGLELKSQLAYRSPHPNALHLTCLLA